MSQEPTDYLLFVAQCANFQSRSMLIPAKEFFAEHKREWQLMRESCVSETLDGQYVDHLLWRIVDWKGALGAPQRTDWNAIVVKLETAMEGDELDISPWDPLWSQKAKRNVISGLDNVDIYCRAQKLTEWQGKPIRIVDSILILEQNRREQVTSKWERPPFSTVDECLEDYVQQGPPQHSQQPQTTSWADEPPTEPTWSASNIKGWGHQSRH